LILVGSNALLNEVEERRKRSLKSLEEEYAVKKKSFLEEAEEQRSQILDAAKREAASSSQKERLKILGTARLESKKIIFEAAEKMAEENVRRLKEALSEYADSDDYRDLLTKMVGYARTRLGEGTVFRCRARDASTIEGAKGKVLSSDLSTIGGLVALNSSRTLELDLTFEELLRIHEEEVRAALLERD
jgi:vacuolar-type H+-ATPase subunit E/Vma4